MAATADRGLRFLAGCLAALLSLTACGSGDDPTADGPSPTTGSPGPPGFTPPPVEEPTERDTAEGRPAHAEGPEGPLQWFGPEDGFQVSGGQFEPDLLPRAFTCFGPGNTPQVRWRNLPEGTATIAIVLTDAEAGTLHWQVTGLDPTIEGFEAAEAFPETAQQGPNAVTGEVGYAPPCAQAGEQRAFRWSLLALSDDPGPQESTDAAAVLAAFRSAALAEVEVESTVGAG